MAIDSMYTVKQKKAKDDQINLTTEEKVEAISREIGKGKVQVYQPSQDDEQKLKWLATRFQVMDSSRPIYRDGDLRYKQFISKLFYRRDGQANTNQPLEFAVIECKMADELAQEVLIDFVPTTKDDTYKVNLTKHVWDFTWNEADTPKEIVVHKLCKNIFGTAFWWETVQKDIFTRYEPVYIETGDKIGMKPVTMQRSYIKGISLDIRDVWVDPVYDIEVAEDCFIRQRDVSYDELYQLTHDENYNKDVILQFLYAQQGKGNNNVENTRQYEVFQTWEETFSYDNQKFSLIHYFNTRLGIYIVCDDGFKFIFRMGANPYPHGELPISVEVDHTNYRSIYGRGECELLESTKYERNLIRNQMLDYVRFSNTINMAVGGGITFQDQELVAGVARVWNFEGDMSQFQMLKPPSQDSGLFSMDEILSKDATWITGIDVNALLGSTQKTAYQARLQEQQKKQRIFLSLRNSDFFYMRMARQRLANIQAFLPETTGKRLCGMDEKPKTREIGFKDMEQKPIMGIDKKGKPEQKGVRLDYKKGNTEFLEITPKMIQSELGIMVTTPSTTPILRDLNRAEMNELLQTTLTFAQFPKGQEFLQKINIQDIWEDQVKDLGLDPLEYMESDEELSPEQEAQQNQEILGVLPMPPSLARPPQKQPQGAGMGMPMQSAQQTMQVQ